MTTSLRELAPIAFRSPATSPPAGIPATSLVFGFSASSFDDLLDTATGVVQVPRIPVGYPPRAYQRWQTTPFFGDLLRVADRVVVGVRPKNGAASPQLYSIPSDLRPGAPTRLPTGSYFASQDDRDVWIAATGRPGRASAVERDPDTGEVVRGPVHIGRHQNLIAAIGGELLSERQLRWPNVELDLVNPVSGAVNHVITRTASADQQTVLDAEGNIVVWQQDTGCGTCEIRVTDVRTAETRLVRWAASQRFLCDTASISPDTRWLAVSYGCPRPDFTGRAPIVMVNIATGRRHIVPGSAESSASELVWTADSKWLIWQGNPAARTRLLAYHLGAYRPRVIPTPHGVTSELLQGWGLRAG